MCISLGNNDSFYDAHQSLNFLSWCWHDSTYKMCSIPYERITAFIKMMKMHYVLKGSNENP